MSDYSGAIEYLIDDSRVFLNHNSVTDLVWHKTAGFNSVYQLGEYFRHNASGVSSHYGIGQDGIILQFVREKDGAGGNCCTEDGHDPYWPDADGQIINLNWRTISVEHIDPALDNSTAPTDAQLRSSFALAKYLCTKYKLTSDHIRTHASIAPHNRSRCPGNYPMDHLRSFIDIGATMHIPPGWADVNGSLHNPFNNNVVVLGFRQHILNDPLWAGDNVPLENEHGVDPVELHNALSGKGTIQLFARTLLVYTPSTGVYESDLGIEYAYVIHKIQEVIR